MFSKCFHAALALGIQHLGELARRLILSSLFDDWLQYPPRYLCESIRGTKYNCANGDRIEILKALYDIKSSELTIVRYICTKI